MKVLFLGNHTVGVKTLSTLSQTEEIVGVVAHPSDPEDGERYLSVYDFAHQRSWPAIRSKGTDPDLVRFARKVEPELTWITDYRYLLPAPVISIAPLGTVNLHPSLLPKYRGRAPINWAIINGEKDLGLTAHFVVEAADAGDIIEQVSFKLNADEDVGDALSRLYPLYQNITRKVLGYFRSGQVPRRKQDVTGKPVYPARYPEDGLIDWKKPAEQIFNLIRAVTRPYPGAFSFYRGEKVMIWSADLHFREADRSHPGQIIAHTDGGFVVQTGKRCIIIEESEVARTGDSFCPKVGDYMGMK